jgi:hypothetical protein
MTPSSGVTETRRSGCGISLAWPLIPTPCRTSSHQQTCRKGLLCRLTIVETPDIIAPDLGVLIQPQGEIGCTLFSCSWVSVSGLFYSLGSMLLLVSPSSGLFFSLFVWSVCFSIGAVRYNSCKVALLCPTSPIISRFIYH